MSAGGLGAEAAQTSVGALVRDYFATPGTWETTGALDRVISAQNLWLAGMNRRRQPAMGLTTLTALVLRGQSYTLAHVGDTRAYLWRAGVLQQLTTDHVVPHHDFSHQLTRSVGSDERLLVDYRQGDRTVTICLCCSPTGRTSYSERMRVPCWPGICLCRRWPMNWCRARCGAVAAIT